MPDGATTSGEVKAQITWSKTPSGMPVFLARPHGPGPFPSVVLLHERYGLVQHTLDIGERLARNGYGVACPDLYFEHPDQEALHAGQARAEVTDEVVLARMEEALGCLCEEAGGDAARLAVMGVCATGRYPLAYSASHPVRACITFYGGLSAEQWASAPLHSTPMERYLDTIEAPILGVYGELDHTIPVSDVLKFRAALEARDKTYEITLYPDVPHGWLNDTMPGRYRKEPAEQTWSQLLSFLGRTTAPQEFEKGPVAWSFSAKKARDYDFSKNTRLE